MNKVDEYNKAENEFESWFYSEIRKIMLHSKVFLTIDSEKFNNNNNIRSSLKAFFPEAAIEEVVNMLEKHSIHLNIKKNLGEAVGRYYHPHSLPLRIKHHRIDILYEMSFDKNHFLWIFLHEYAHLLVHVNNTIYGDHCNKWKETYKDLLLRFIQLNIFPEDFSQSIQQQIERGLTRYD